jgi:hypothetical protein
LIVFALWGVALGLWQQIPELPAEQADCSYRVELMRDRLETMMDRLPAQAPPDSEADQVFANLLRETHVACADASPDLAIKLERINAIHARDRERRRETAAARAELSALEGFFR